MKNTLCKNCIFAKPASNNVCCEFDIISHIKDERLCEIKDDYWYIHNYQCRFALGEKMYETQIKNMVGEKDFDLKQYIAYLNTIRYYLVIDFIEPKHSVNQLCHQLKQLQIPPKFISVIFYRQNTGFMTGVIESFKEIIGDTIEYKIHNFIEQVTPDEALFTVLETTIKKNNTQYLWLMSNSSLGRAVADGDIEKLNYQINVAQPICNMLRSKNNTSNLDTLFLNFENYTGITKNINQSLSAGILSLSNISIYNYD